MAGMHNQMVFVPDVIVTARLVMVPRRPIAYHASNLKLNLQMALVKSVLLENSGETLKNA